MYYCPDCRKEFEFVKISFQHGEKGSEKVHLCPFCEGTSFVEKKGVYCHYCGMRIGKGENYCSTACRRAGEKLFKKQEENRRKRKENPLYISINEVDNYNKEHSCSLSYGQYFALKGANML